MSKVLDALKRLVGRILGCDPRAWLALLILALPAGAVAGDEKAFQAGLQLGARWGDNQIQREGTAPDFVLGVALGWVFHEGWILFGDANYSQNPTPEYCDSTPYCRWSTPKAQVLTARVGVERRFVREDRKSHWAIATAVGWIDLELKRIQFHSPSVSLALAHRIRVGPGALRLEARVDQGIDRRTDPDLTGVLEKARMRQYSLLMGYDCGLFDVDDLKRWKATRWLFGDSSD